MLFVDEIRTPMNGILGACQLILDEPLGHEANSLARMIYQSASSLLVVIDDVLVTHRYRCRKREREREWVSHKR
jgi:signal transduction histidine kinase